MAADDTSRDALIERVAEAIHGRSPLTPDRCDLCVESIGHARDVVDAVVMPLVQEWDRLRAIAPEVRAAQHLAEVSALSIRDAMAAVGVVAERDAAIKRAEAAEAAHEKLTAAVRGIVDALDRAPVSTQVAENLRAILDEHGAGR